MANEYGIIRLSPRRWCVVRRRIVTGRQLVGYGKATPRPGGLGHELSEPMWLDDWTEYEVVPEYASTTHDMAMRGLYELSQRRNDAPACADAPAPAEGL